MPTTEIPRGSFADVIATSTRGAINDDATAEMRKLVAEMQTVQRNRGGEPKGKMTLELSFKVNENGVFEITSDIKVKRPAMAKTRAFLFATKDGSLSEEDQRQMKLPLGEVKDVSTASTSNVRDISDRRPLAANDKD